MRACMRPGELGEEGREKWFYNNRISAIYSSFSWNSWLPGEREDAEIYAIEEH